MESPRACSTKLRRQGSLRRLLKNVRTQSLSLEPRWITDVRNRAMSGSDWVPTCFSAACQAQKAPDGTHPEVARYIALSETEPACDLDLRNFASSLTHVFGRADENAVNR